MLTLYTAVGKLQIRKNSAGKEYPLVMVGEKEPIAFQCGNFFA